MDKIISINAMIIPHSGSKSYFCAKEKIEIVIEDSYKNPWKRKSSKKIYENPWIQIDEDQVVRPNGSEGIYGKVHFKNKALGIIPIDAEQNTWLVGQYRYTLNEYSWEIPMGGVPLTEDTLQGAKRELQEETGLKARKWTRLFRIHTSNSVTDEYGYVYLAEELEQGETNWDETEELLIKKMPLKDAIMLVEAGKITDALSISGLLMIGRKLGL